MELYILVIYQNERTMEDLQTGVKVPEVGTEGLWASARDLWESSWEGNALDAAINVYLEI